uniref:Uncharacterized protein n=1 Tax=viral metagenome TaxID=1070528 RepID=A0A6M3L2B2_9ZZZZ
MKYTEWKAKKSPLGDWIISSEYELIARELRHWNVNLIVEAVNACIRLNPENPLAVAQSIEGAFAVCKYLAEQGWNAGVTEDALKVLADSKTI